MQSLTEFICQVYCSLLSFSGLHESLKPVTLEKRCARNEPEQVEAYSRLLSCFQRLPRLCLAKTEEYIGTTVEETDNILNSLLQMRGHRWLAVMESDGDQRYDSRIVVREE
jgi:hypothetical protein